MLDPRTARFLVTLALLGALGAACQGPQPTIPAPAPALPARPMTAWEPIGDSAIASDLLSRLQALPRSPLAEGLAAGFEAVPDGLRPHFAASAPVSARVILPGQSLAATWIEDTETGARVDVSLEHALVVDAEPAKGYVVYPGAHVSGATVLHRPLTEGLEDFISFEKPPRVPRISYKVSLRQGIAGLRLVAGTLELLDVGGTPRLRVAPPYLVGADGERTDAELAVEGCAVDRSPAAPWGRPVTDPGSDTCTVRVSWNDEAIAYPAVLDPRWTTTGSMTVARQDHTAILLSTGKVLVAGGRSSGTSTTGLKTAELFDTITGKWATTGSMTGGRYMHTATQLGTNSNAMTSGKVLIAGGLNGTASVNTAELYNPSPSSGIWAPAGNLNAFRHAHTATLLADGKVLVAGGLNGTATLASAAVYNPASGAGSWTATTGPIPPPGLKAHTATLLTTAGAQLKNKVLLVGGNNGSNAVGSVFLFDPAQSQFSTLTALPSPREGHTTTVLANGNLLVAGGKNGTTLRTSLIFNPSSGMGTWTPVGDMTAARQLHTATLLANGQVLVAGGSSGSAPLASAELFNGTNAWAATTALPAAVQAHTAVLLTNNAVLIAGGANGTTVSAARLYDVTFGAACTTNSQCVTGFCASGVCCDAACTGSCNACNLAGKVGTCSIAPSGTTCRAAAGVCDVAETCNGTSITCPADSFLADGTACNDANVCTQNDTCRVGQCQPGPLDVICAISPTVEGITTVNGQQVAVFSYNNSAPQNTNIPYGPQNFLTPPGNDPTSAPASPPPAWFTPGVHRGAFTSPLVNGALSWTLGTRTVTANATSPVLPLVTKPEGSGVDLGGGVFVVLVPDYTPDVTAAIVRSDTGGSLVTPGKTAGSFDVTDDGAATYKIPLWVPDGRAGLQPHLALEYSSRDGDGPLGLGWHIGGLSAITRCHADFARDGVTKPVQFNSEDKLCLDGEPLVLFSGTHMQTNAEYRTEHDRFLKIVIVGADASGPTGFLVYHPDGLRSSYGSESNPSISAFSGHATAVFQDKRQVVTPDQTSDDPPTLTYESVDSRLTWALASVKDRYDNEITYRYRNFGTPATTHIMENLPEFIFYTSRPGLSGDRTVSFDWGDSEALRNDRRTSFVSGLALQNTRLLRHMLISGPNPVTSGLLRQYTLDYVDFVGQHATVQAVTECDRDFVCKPPTKFEWTPLDETFQKRETAITDIYDQIVPADINGDGIDDIIYRQNAPGNGQFASWFFRLGSGKSIVDDDFGSAVRVDYPAQEIFRDPNFIAHGGRVADINADGKVDFLYPAWDGGSFHRTLRSFGTGFTVFDADPAIDKGPLGVRAGSYIGDFTGDGLPDVMRTFLISAIGRLGWFYRKNDAVTGLGPSQVYTYNPVGETDSHYPESTDKFTAYAVDTDGDGKLELIYQQTVPTPAQGGPLVHRMWALGEPASPVSALPKVTSLLTSARKASSLHYQMMDVNGDGLADAVAIQNAGGDLTVAINNGRDFLPPTSWTPVAAGKLGQSMDILDDGVGVARDPGLRIMDANLDGRADIFLMDEGCYNTGIFNAGIPFSRLSPAILHAPGFTYTSLGASVPIGFSQTTYNTQTGFPMCSGTYSTSRVLDLNGDGLMDFVQIEPGTQPQGKLVLYTHRGQRPGLLFRITDGLGKQTVVDYKPITDPSVHTPAQCSYPLNCSPRGMWLVWKHTVDSSGTPAVYQHKYSGGKSDLRGLGWIGMDEHIETDMSGPVPGVAVHTRYDHTFPDPSGARILSLRSTPTEKEIVVPLENGAATISRKWKSQFQVTSVNGDARVVVTPKHVSFSETESRVVGGVTNIYTNREWETDTNYNQQYGYLLSRHTLKGGTAGETEDLVLDGFNDNATEWLVGLNSGQTETYTTPARTVLPIPTEQKVRRTTFTREPSGAIKTITVEPASSDVSLHLVTEFFRNAAGQVYRTTQTTLDGQVRSSFIDSFDPVSSTYPYQVRNALNQKGTLVYHPGLGELIETKDPNGLLSTRTLDGFGRLRGESHPDGSSFIQSYVAIPIDGGMQTVVDAAGANIKTSVDRRGQEVKVDRRDDTGAFNTTTIQYDRYGRVTGRWRPYPSGTATPLTTLPLVSYTYDNLDRRLTESFPPSSTTCNYLSIKTHCETLISTGAGDNTSVDSITDSLGRLVEKDEVVGHVLTPPAPGHTIKTRYVYGPFGVLRNVVDTAGNVTAVGYDDRGRRISILDPDRGLESDTYDAFGQQKNVQGNGQVTTVGYDALGRRISELTAEGGAVPSVFTWDTAANGVGQLSSHSSPDGATVAFEYDSRGRRSAEIGTLVGGGAASRLDFGYDDSSGRPKAITYPSVGTSRYQVQFNYTSLSGELKTITDGASALIWRADTRNPERNLTKETFGDSVVSTRGYEAQRGYLQSILTLDGANVIQNLGFTYDMRGFLQFRNSYVGNEQETFQHDELGRLKLWGGGDGHVDYGYDDLGNLSTRTSVRTGSPTEVKTFNSGVTAGPHAVTSVTTTGQPNETYGYDLSGRQKTGPDRTIDYTDFDLPRRIIKAGVTWTFKYDASHQRAVKQGPNGTNYYLGDLYERRTAPNGTVTHVMYVPGERGVVAQGTQVAGGALLLEYLHDDHLGSIGATTSKVGTGSVQTIQERFDPFGSRIGPTSPPMSTPPPSSTVTIGFTGQEHDDGLGLINMGGRIYDPALARFLTPDPVVARLWRSQSLNRYSYVENSPVRSTDPSGFCDCADTNDGDGDEFVVDRNDDYTTTYDPNTETYYATPNDDRDAPVAQQTDGENPDHVGGGHAAAADDGEHAQDDDDSHAFSLAEDGKAYRGPSASGDGSSGPPLPPGAKDDAGYQACLGCLILRGVQIVQPIAQPIIDKGTAQAAAAALAIGAAAAYVTYGIKIKIAGLFSTQKEAEKEFRTNPDFREWVHRDFKPSIVGSDGTTTNPDLTPEQIKDAYDEWVDSGKPARK